MAESDWTDLTGSLASGVVRRGVTPGITPPNGGGSFVHGWHSVTAGQEGAHGRFYNAANFAPMSSGGRAEGALVRLASGGPTNFAPMLFFCLQGNSVNNAGYLFGLQDDDPSYIVLRKGVLSQGLPEGDASDPTSSPNILRRSVDTIDVNEWVHLRLDVVANGTGDVILKMFRNDLTAHTVTSPTWEAISGMGDFTDDALGINTGSVPHTSGYAGFAFYLVNVTRRGAVDHVRIARQL